MTIAKRNAKNKPQSVVEASPPKAPTQKKSTFKELKDQIEFLTDQLILANGAAMEAKKEAVNEKANSAYFANQLKRTQEHLHEVAEERDALQKVSTWELIKKKFGF